MTKQVVIWGAWYGSRNVGDQLLLLAITDILNQYLPSKINFTVLTDDAVWVEEYTSQESDCNIKAIQSRQNILSVINELRKCDLLIFGGGVPFFEKPFHVFVMTFLVGVVRFFSKPYLLWAVSSQKIQSKFALRVFSWVLRGTEFITYRDKATQDLFQLCGVKLEDMRQVADPGFALDLDADSKGIEILKSAGWNPDGRPLVALTPRYLRTADGEAETHYTIESPQQYQQEMECFVAANDWLWENGYQPIYIPMNTVAPDDDLIAAREIIAQAKYGEQALITDKVLRPRTVPGLYKQCQVSFVARVHGSISSMLGNCPMMMFSFAPKHSGIMELMAMEDYCLSLKLATPQHTIKLLESLISNRNTLQHNLKNRLSELQKDAIYPTKLIDLLWEQE